MGGSAGVSDSVEDFHAPIRLFVSRCIFTGILKISNSFTFGATVAKLESIQGVNNTEQSQVIHLYPTLSNNDRGYLVESTVTLEKRACKA